MNIQYRIYSIGKGEWYTTCITHPQLNELGYGVAHRGTLKYLRELGYDLSDIVTDGDHITRTPVAEKEGTATL